MQEVMIIDDEEDLRELIETMLVKEGYDVLKAENGEKALDILEDKTPNLILLDIHMPGLDGWETLEEMERRGITEDSPVIMFTVEELTFVKMLRKDIEGLVGYIEKPFERKKLLKIIKEYIEKTEKIRDLRKKIEKNPEGGDYMAEAYEAWSRSQMIHERFLEKLKELEDKYNDKEKLARIKNMKKGEKNTIENLEHKKEELIQTTNLKLDEKFDKPKIWNLNLKNKIRIKKARIAHKVKK